MNLGNTFTHGSRLARRFRTPRRVLVTELQHVVLIHKGRVGDPLPPGRHRISRRHDRLWTEPATPQVMVVPSQEVLTSDGATVRVTVSSTVVIREPVATLRSGEWRGRFHLDVQHALRAAVTTATLEDLVGNRAGIDDALRPAVEVSATTLGLELIQLNLRDLVATGEPKRQLAEVVAARLAGQAQLERARGETAALRHLANAASMVKDNPDLFRLRLLQEIAASSGNTFVIDTDASPGNAG